MSRKTLGLAMLVVGGIGLLVTLASNPLGIGTNPREFGWLQEAGTALAFALIGAGAWLRWMPATALIVAGGIALVVSLAADPLGLGSNLRVFGWLQVAGTVLGLVLMAVGVILGRVNK